MSNNAYLLNTESLSNDSFELIKNAQNGGPECVEIASAAYRVPAVWFFLFQQADLEVIDARFLIGPEETESVRIALPSTTVDKAKRNFESSLDDLQKITPDKAIAKGYWDHTLEGLNDLPFDNLTLNPIEVILMVDPAADAEQFAKAFDRSDEAISLVKRLAGYNEGTLPYSAGELFSLPPDKLDDDLKMENASAIDPAFSDPGSRYWHKRTAIEIKNNNEEIPEETSMQARDSVRRPWWKVW